MTEGSTHLSDADALIWRIEGDPVLRSPILVVGLLDRSPAPDRLRRSLVRAAEEIPHLRERIVDGPLGSNPRWLTDADFSLDHHVRRTRATTPDLLRSALDLAEPDVMAAFDPARPLWRLTIVEALSGGGAAFVLRFHHAITDGVGAIEMAERIFDTTRRARPASGAAATDTRRPAPASGPSVLSGASSLVRGVARAGMDPVATVRAASRTARSVVKMLSPARAPLSPILVGRGLDRDLHVLDLPLADLRLAAHAAGGTVNDVFLAAVGGGLRHYHERCGAPIDAVRVTMPISLRVEGDAAGGNHFTPARFVLPIDDPDPARRVEVAGTIVRSWRSEPAVGLTSVLAQALDLLPTPVVQRAFAGMLRSVDVDAVDVPGLRRPAYLAGAEVERLWAFAPPTGAAMSVTLVSHVDRACVGIAADLAAVEDPGLLAGCFVRGFDEVLALAGTHAGTEIPA